MSRTVLPALGLLAALGAAFPAQAASLQEAAALLGVDQTRSIEISATGRWFQFGQAPNPNQPWPQFDVSSYTAAINYGTPAARVQITRKQAIDPARLRPAPVEQKVDQYVSGAYAWNLATAGNAAATAQPAALEERRAEIWATPQGFLKAALANHAATQPAYDGVEVSFTLDGKYRYVGTINSKNQLEQVRTWIDNPVLGDTVVETWYSNYKDFGGVKFPAYILRNQGGHPVLDLQVSSVKLNPAVDIPVPPEAANAPAVTVAANKLAEGVWYLTGGTHHSVAIEQQDHVVLVEAPQNEARSLAVIAKVKEIIPGKPIKYLVNTHHHFDHSGGLRTFVDEGATIVTHQLAKAYYDKAWATPRTLGPDRLAKSGKVPAFSAFGDKQVLTDGKRAIEIHSIAGSGHSDGFALVYLPAEKILIEADAYTPAAANASPTAPNPYTANLYDNIRKLKLDVEQIAALHGPRVTTLADLRAAIGETVAAK